MEHASLPTEEFSSKLSGAEPPLSWPLQMTSGHSTDCLVCHDSLPFHILSFPYEAELSPDVRTAAGGSWRQHISCHRTCAHAHHISCHARMRTTSCDATMEAAPTNECPVRARQNAGRGACERVVLRDNISWPQRCVCLDPIAHDLHATARRATGIPVASRVRDARDGVVAGHAPADPGHGRRVINVAHCRGGLRAERRGSILDYIIPGPASFCMIYIILISGGVQGPGRRSGPR